MHALELLAGQAGIARGLGAAGEQHGVELAVQASEGAGDADIDAVMELHALGLHLPHAAVDVALLHLEVGDAVAQQAAGLRLALEDVDVVADAGELLGRRETRRPRADHRHLLAGLHRGGLGHHPAHAPGLVGDRLFDGLDRDRLVLEVEGAGLLAGRGADAAGEFRKVVGGVQVARRLLPVRVEDEVVPVGDLVVDRAARRAVAERDAAIHAARRLLLQVVLVERQGEFEEVAHAVGRELILLLLPVELEEACDLAHRVSAQFVK